MRRAYSCRAAAAVFSDDARTQKRADGMLSALECLDAHRNIGPIIAQRLCAVNSRQKQCRAVSAKAVQSGISAGWRFYIYGRVGFLKIRGSAVLRSKMPACSGQADPSRRRARFCEAECPRAAGRRRETVLAAARRQSCPAAQSVFAAQFRMHQAAKPPMAAIRLALGGWLHAVQKP